MTIGQLAAAAGISTRAVRHYHRIGLLPERTRRSNGYREYDIKDLLMLLRIRRLTGLGVSLSDCAVALTSPNDAGLRELLVELDQELAIQESEIGARRLAISALAETFFPSNAPAGQQHSHSGIVGEAAWAGFEQTLSPAQLRCVQLAKKAIEL